MSGRRNPIQPIITDELGHQRFRANALVRYLLDNGPFDFSALALVPASDDDRAQFAALTGYSLSGFGELSYVDDETFGAATMMAEFEYESETIARLDTLREQLSDMKNALRPVCEQLFGQELE